MGAICANWLDAVCASLILKRQSAMTAPRARKQHRPSSPPDLLPSRRAGHPSPSTASAAGRRVSRACAARARALAPTLLALLGALALPAPAAAQTETEVLQATITVGASSTQPTWFGWEGGLDGDGNPVSSCGDFDSPCAIDDPNNTALAGEALGWPGHQRYLTLVRHDNAADGGTLSFWFTGTPTSLIDPLVDADYRARLTFYVGAQSFDGEVSGFESTGNIVSFTSTGLTWASGDMHTVRITLTEKAVTTPPDAPTDFRAAAGDAQVALAWKARALDSGVTRHEFRYTTSADYPEDWTPIPNSAPDEANEDSFTVTMLTNEVAHTFELRAVNAAGEAGAAAEAGPVTPTPGICGRTQQVQDAIFQIVGLDNCAEVSAADLSRIQSLGLNSSEISSLRDGDFDGLSALTSLQLQTNSLSELPAAVFKGLSALTSLQLQTNSLSGLPEAVFDELTALTSLQLQTNSLSGLPADVFDGLTALSDLQLNDNSLSVLPADVFDGLTALETLHLNRNTLSGLPDGVFDGLTALDTLYLHRNELSDVQAGLFDGLTALKRLDLRYNSLSSLHEDIFDGLTALETLHLDRNTLSGLPAGVFDEPTALQTLYLQFNSLSSLPEGVFDGLTALKFLSLQFNSLSDLPAGIFENLTVLETLKLVANPGGPFVPTANAGGDRRVAQAAAVTLDGSASGGAWGTNVTYQWTETGGATVTLSGADTDSPSFTAPSSDAELVFTLTVTGKGVDAEATYTDTDTATVRVGDASTDATLSGLAVSGGGADLLTFASDTTTYTVMVTNEVETLTFTPTKNDALAGVAYLDSDGNTLDDADTAEDGFQVPLEVGANAITVRVTAENGATVQDYTVTVTRAEALPAVTIAADHTSFTAVLDQVTFTLTRTGDTAEGLDVSVALTQDKDLIGSDDLAQTVAFRAGEDTATLNIYANLFAGSTVTGETTLTATVQDGTGYVPGSQATASTRIRVADPAVTASFEQAAYTFDEAAGDATVAVILRTATGVSVPHADIFLYISSEIITDGASPDDFEFSAGDIQFVPSDFTADGANFTARKEVTLAIVDDEVNEPDEALTMVLEPLGGTQSVVALREPDGTACSTDTRCDATVTITDNDPLPTLSVANAEAAEGDDVTFTVTLSEAAADNVTVDWATSVDTGDTATEGTDFTAASGTLTFMPGDTAMTFAVTTVEDTTGEDNETFTVTLSSPSSNATLTTDPATAAGTINDNDGGALPSMTVLVGTGFENTGVPVQVTLSSAAAQDVTVDWTVSLGSDDTAELGDLQATTGTATVTEGETQGTFTVAVNNDTTDEDDETFTLTLSNAMGAVLGADPTGTGTITDDDDPPGLSAESAATDEGGPVEFTVTLTPASERTVTVAWEAATLAVEFRPAVAGTDYTAASGTLTFMPGDTEQTVTVQTTQDTADEFNETFTLTLSDPLNATLGSDPTAVGTITDNDPLPTLSVADAEAVEGSAVTFTATLSPVSGREVTVDWAPSAETGDNATSDTDFTAAPAATLTFMPGDTTATFAVQTTADTVDEDDETFTVTLSNAMNATLATDPTATGTIIDDDLPVVTIAKDKNLITENEGAAGFTLSRTGSTAAALTVTVEVTQEVDRDLLPDGAAAERRVTFAVDSATATLSVTLENDDLKEAAGDLTVEVRAGSGYTVGNPASATVTVSDTDSGRPTPANLRGASVGAGVGEVVLSWDAHAPYLGFARHQYRYKTDGDYPAEWTDIPNSGLNHALGGDGSNLTGYTVTGLVGGQVHTFQVRTYGSSSSASDPSDEATATPRSAAVSFGAESYSVDEGDTVAVTVQLDAAPGREVVVPVSAAGAGGATPPGETGADWSGVPESVTFGATDTAITFALTATDDTDVDPDESVALSFGTLPDWAMAGTPSEATVTIVDDDLPVVTIAADTDTGTVIELEGAVGFTLSRTGPTAATLTVTVEVTQQVDRDLLPDGAEAVRTVTFAVGSATTALRVTLDDDDLDDVNGTLTVEVQAGSGYTVGEPGSATVSVIDLDTGLPQPANLMAEAGSGVGEVALSWDAHAPGLVFARHQYRHKTDGDYPAAWTDIPDSGQHDTAAGDGSNLTGYTVTGLVGGQVHTFQVRTYTRPSSVSDPSDEAMATPPRSVFVTFGAGSYSVDEGGTVEVTVRLDAAPGREVTVPVSAAGAGGATPPGETGADWSGVPESVTFGAADTEQTFTLAATDDTDADTGESVALSFGTLPAGVTVGDRLDVATVTIVDDDAAPIDVTVGADTLVSTAKQDASTTADGGSVSLWRHVAQEFRTGSNADGYTLTGVDIVSASSTRFTAKVCRTNAGGLPTSTCTALTPPDSFAVGVMSFTVPADTTATLTKERTYAVVVQALDLFVTGRLLHGWGVTDATGEDPESAAGWTVTNGYRWDTSPSILNWSGTNSDQTLRMVIRGAAVAASTDATLSDSGRQRRHFGPDADAGFRTGQIRLRGVGGDHRRRGDGDGDGDGERFRRDDRISGRGRHDARRRRHLGGRPSGGGGGGRHRHQDEGDGPGHHRHPDLHGDGEPGGPDLHAGDRRHLVRGRHGGDNS